MSGVTDADRERAEDLACDLWNDMGNANVVDIVGEQAPVHAVIDGWADAIAAALAEEREKARAPFRDLVGRLRSCAIASGQAGMVAYQHAAVMVDAAGQDRA